MVENSIALDAINKEAVDLKNIPLEEVFDNLKCTREGLTANEVQERLDLFGHNKLEEKKESKLLKFLGFMWNPLSRVMEAAALMAISLAHEGVNLVRIRKLKKNSHREKRELLIVFPVSSNGAAFTEMEATMLGDEIKLLDGWGVADRRSS